MNKQAQINSLKSQIKNLEREISNCKHIWKDSKYDPEKEMKGYGSVQDGAGSDPHWSFAGYTEVDKPRWSRECKECGKVEYTYTQENIITKSELKPKF